MLRYKHIITVLLLLGFTLQANALSKNINEWLNKLDRSLEKAPMYKAEHEQQINDLKKLVTGRETLGTRFEIYHRIYLAYQHYHADSAYVYAQKSFEVAQQMNSNLYMALAKCNLAFIYSMAGDNMQAFEEVADLDSNYMPLWLKIEYFKTMLSLWGERTNSYLSNNPDKNKYREKANQCVDSLVAITKPYSTDWYRYNTSKLERQGNVDRLIAFVDKAWHMKKINT